MPIKMKKCADCNSLCSNSASKCQVCGSRNLVKGSFTTKEEAQIKQLEKEINQREVILCSFSSSPVPLTNGKGYCVYCDDEIKMVNGIQILI
ncbi:hypothetical protein WQ57_09660 [Mesobacillus campisalis]|uniref:Uncharacterized protein n=1 Tax=Mesobacillus campisalis TaxID=1408103 RepID=A0A0M2SV88_9BACI|nr:hypothetical protein [Mesobacillus campisalis]KKK38083.1 hypothetical protein WQ57_09660 [Mesobacillus campisalis]